MQTSMPKPLTNRPDHDILKTRTIPCARDRRAHGGLLNVSRSAGNVSGLFSFFVRCRGNDDAAEGSGGMSDRTLTCRDCGQAFTFTAGEQAFYPERGFSEPQRCPSCRAPARRSAPRAGTTPAIAVAAAEATSSGGYSGGGGSYSSGGYGGGGGGYSPVAAVATPPARARCTRRSAPSAARRPKFPSSRAPTSRSTAGSASSCGGRQRLLAATTTKGAKRS